MPRLLAHLFLPLVTLLTFTSSACCQTYSASGDFSATNNPNGVWQYGWTQTLGSTFNIDTIHENSGGLDAWEGSIPTADPPGHFPIVIHNGTANTINSGTISVAAGQLGFHPGPNGQNSVVRFTAPAAGLIRLQTTFSGIDSVGTSTDVHVLVNNTAIFNGNIAGFGSTQSFSQDLTLAVGDRVDFTVGFGTNGTYFNDSTGLAATFTPVPEPGGVTVIGGVALMLVAGRRKLRTGTPLLNAGA